MGVDVVEIGIRHRLPVQDPKKLAQEMATIFNTNVKVVALNEFEYDERVIGTGTSDSQDERI